MSDKSNQQISNLMDGELESNASKFLLKRMASDNSLSQTWENYHLIKSCLQKQKEEPLMIDVARNVCESISGKTTVIEAEKPQVNRWLKPLMGISIAASVAFMSVLMLKNQQIESPLTNSPIIAKQTVLNPIIETPIEATMASSRKTFVPPASLSRFPSVSAKNQYQTNNSGMVQGANLPYLILINQQAQKPSHRLSPMRVKDISD